MSSTNRGVGREPSGDGDRRAGKARRGGGGPAGGGSRPPNRERTPGEAWNAVGTLGAGIAFWGLVGWGIDRLTGLHNVFLPIGIVLGLAAALYLVIYQALRR
ncbi:MULTISPECIES: AtpZ/AtpI family protein [Pseudofrankia]|uniref:AtpZ/AtpI family protein n=1 Tax=Pseudofrankia TaxID=2994363 RepID=UPI000234CDF0|nr:MULTISPECIES: AtpZ/AtpI family protein [Pseudofrankia]